MADSWDSLIQDLQGAARGSSCRQQPEQGVRCGQQGQAGCPGKGGLTSRLFGQSWGILGSRGPRICPRPPLGTRIHPPPRTHPRAVLLFTSSQLLKLLLFFS